jgi:hypothetical protein
MWEKINGSGKKLVQPDSKLFFPTQNIGFNFTVAKVSQIKKQLKRDISNFCKPKSGESKQK